MTHLRERQKMYYDQGAKPLPSLRAGDSVRLRSRIDGTWEQSYSSRAKGRSFIVEGKQGTSYRRNRLLLMKTKETWRPERDEYPDSDPPVTARQRPPSSTPESSAPVTCSPTSMDSTPTADSSAPTPTKNLTVPAPTTTASGRAVKLPSKFKDFVM